MVFKNSKCVLAAMVLASAAVSVGTAQANSVLNPSFEDSAPNNNPAVSPGDNSTIPNWTVIGGGDGVAWIASPSFGIPADDGPHNLDLTSYSNGAPYGGVQQTITTIANSIYNLTFDLGREDNSGTYAITASAGSTTQTLGVTVGPNPTNQFIWTQMTMNFTTTGTSTILSLLGSSSGGSQEYIGLDNVDVEFVGPASTTPLPAALPLFATGLAGLGWFARRRRNQASA